MNQESQSAAGEGGAGASIERMTGDTEPLTLTARDLPGHVGETITVRGAIQAIRAKGKIAFVVLRTRDDMLQAVSEDLEMIASLREIKEGTWVRLTGNVVAEPQAPGGVDFRLTGVEVIAEPAELLPVTISKKQLQLSLPEKLDYRVVSLRHPRERAIFRVQNAIVSGYRRFLTEHGFTEIRTPKIVSVGAEGGANLFRVDYFGEPAYLAQSPQLYKQYMVGVYERVFEVAPVYRAERHRTSRHLNEYISLDFEMGFVTDHRDVMTMEVKLLRAVMDEVGRLCVDDLGLLGVTLPTVGDIPSIRMAAAAEIASRALGREVDPDDLDPEAEVAVSTYAHQELGSEFVFITHYPDTKRPFYTKNDPDAPNLTRSFDLLFRGMEVTTGGQRINDYGEQVEKLRRFGLDPADFESFLMLHKYGIPPHGGCAIGLERLTMKLLGLENVREAALFPRDIGRLNP